MHRLVLSVVLVAVLACTGAPSGPPEPVSQAPAPPAPAAPSAAPAAPEIPLYSAAPLDRSALKGETLRELALMRNTIFARVGNPFNKAWLRDYFAAQPWYRPLARAELEKLSDIDRQNAALIAEVESSFTSDELLARKDALLGKAGALTPEDNIELELLSTALGQYVVRSGATPAEQRSPLEDPSVLDRKLKPAQIQDLSRRDLRIARNTIFARHGRAFQSEILAAWFAQKSWYTVDPNYSDSSLTAIDKANIALLKAREEELGGALTEEDHALEEAMGNGMFAA